MNTSSATSADFSRRDVFALGFMTFALFLGAGNIFSLLNPVYKRGLRCGVQPLAFC